MKKITGFLFAIMLLVTVSVAAQAQGTSVTGKWNMKVETADRSGTPVFNLRQQGDSITGTYTGQLGEAPVKGLMKKNEIRLEFIISEIAVVYSGTVEGDMMKGKAVFGELGEGTFSGIKEK